jgi:RHS repeat-associated protein
VADKLAATVSSVDGTSNYSYDVTNQLIGTDHTNQTDEAYQYDANGNRTSGGTVTGVNNQLLNDGTYSYQYDGEGNRTKRTEISTGKVIEYIWDYRNRLTAVLFKDALGNVTKTIDYIYDGNNQRIGKRIDGAVTERYVIDRNQIALVFDGAGVQTHRYLYGTAVDQVLADETAISTNWLLGDNLGTIRDVVDSNGTLVDHINYDSFGKVQSQSNPGYDLRYGYTGREQDNETGLDYYRARYYDAANGRFISEDPLGFGAGDTNVSRYVKNSPTNWVDPSGKEPEQRLSTDVDTYIDFLNKTKNKMGRLKNQEAEDALFRQAATNGAEPTNTGEISNAPLRYIYTEKGGWIDMSHFLYYGGRAIKYKRLKFFHPVSLCVQDGYAQEIRDLTQPFAHSAFSYEDLPSDRLGAEFAINYFNPKSNRTFGEQLRNYLKNKLGATEPTNAPNWNQIPWIADRTRPPTWVNTSTSPMFTKPLQVDGFWDNYDRYPSP